ncbi:ABC transporter ATP-binding protein [Lacticaseibacillus zeae]|uniref:ABC transporter ATP-binding protein n=1 Tax=Lacticaseibacillus zeae subsp. silagei TaxID=3068307 RepID=A0ABD7Z953_LACZE|nr:MULTISPECIES: ABC transporter ATP-binding protein [Lacticaseibacillus]MDE3316780.1 ABC transporter ATP-binding protein [Lacticaseibacillus zeae]OFR95945.1 cobalt ABC transporter ATP-binding protein [Lactobacillus sp. HMSC068F07]WLV83572.1 ABC transporter ATP-binding protein [Lacticaseibacillus sp. NCIMB 15475]WLV86321.1 ABC transporter ATP-binding protein [Lacticaseibacillus sp. NCIMB 15474]
MTRITIEHLTKSLSGRNILQVENLSFESGEIYGLVGPNGAGKTTLLRCICGLIIPDGGEIQLNELVLDRRTRSTFLKHIGSVFAQSDSIFDLTIDTLLTEHYHYFCLKRPKDWHELLQNVALEITPKQKIGSLSLGMRQRLLLALAISHDPSILILDEPFNGLDPDGVNLTKKLINDLAKDKVVIITSHSFADLNDIMTQSVVIAHGQTSGVKKLAAINSDFTDGLADFYREFVRHTNSLN